MTNAKDLGSSAQFADIGARLRAHRIGQGLSPETFARRLGISRAALYRAEKGEIAKIEMLTAISNELAISLPSLLGVGIEYLPSAPAFFERMRQLEENCDQIIGVFSPVSYLLTSENYDRMLKQVFEEVSAHNKKTVAKTLEILRARKLNFRNRQPLIASVVSILELQGYLKTGMAGSARTTDEEQLVKRRAATMEVQLIATMLRDQPIGVQIGVTHDPLPSTSFQIMRSGNSSMLAISPFRLGQHPNIDVGVGLVTSAPEALELHENIAQKLWKNALKGEEAAAEIDDLIEAYGEF